MIGLGLAWTLACATSSGSSSPGRAKKTPQGRPIPKSCKAPKRSRALAWVLYPGDLCPRDMDVTIRSEDEFAKLVACPLDQGESSPSGEESAPSGIDWSTHELFVHRSWYQGDPGRFVRVADTDEGRVAQFHQAPYCSGAAPPSGELTHGLLLPRRDAGSVTVIGCDRELCDWEINGSSPPP